MTRKGARRLAEGLMGEHLTREWTFDFDNATRRWGQCNYSKQRITISKSFVKLNSMQSVQDTILHEIAHALAGNRAGHGAEWKRICIDIGGTGEARKVANKLPDKFTGTCPNCKTTTTGMKRTRVACLKCCKEHNNNLFDESYLFEWTRN